MKAQGYIEETSDEGLGVLKAEKPIYIPYTVVGDFVKVYKTRRRFGKSIAERFEVAEFSQLRQVQDACILESVKVACGST